jgi:hypothetical protein
MLKLKRAKAETLKYSNAEITSRSRNWESRKQKANAEILKAEITT